MSCSHWRGTVMVCLILATAAGLFAQAPANSATFVRTDSSTQGNWPSGYGADGYFLPTISASQPSYLSAFSSQNANTWTWASSTIDPRALRVPGGNSETATTWYNSASFYFDVTVAPGQTHQVALYAMDWDSGGRSESISIVDGDTNTVLDSRILSNFVNGEYLIWNISGHVKINIATVAGLNAVVSGVFFETYNVIRVPQDQPTIQAAINATQNGYTVLVSPGTYHENINFNGKAITVTSSAGPSTTVIDGGLTSAVAAFESSEGSGSVLNGFTLQNGFTPFANGYMGGGVFISGSSPTITNNKIINNTGCEGSGIGAIDASPTIQGNVIDHNSGSGSCSPTRGGGIAILGGTGTRILNNTITNNSVSEAGGIYLNGAEAVTIRGNLISGNSAPSYDGGGIEMINETPAIIVDNVIVGNTAGVGAGVYALVPSGTMGPTLINNTIANNNAQQVPASGIYIEGFDSQSVFVNNVVVAPSGQQAITCDGDYSALSPLFSYNDVYSGGGQAWAGTCDSTTNPGNISTDPLFVNPAVSNYHLQPGSLAINVGNNSAPNFPAADFDGNPRIYNGTVDLGAYEYQGPTTLSFSPTSLAFPSQLVGGTTQPMSVTLTNTGNTALQISSISASTGFSETETCQTATGIAVGQSCQISVQFAPVQPDYQAGGISVSANLSPNPATFSVSGTGIANSAGSSANFLGTDSATRGNWSANYGAEGYSIANGPQNLPTYDPSFALANQLNWTWAASTTDPRALQLPGGSVSIATTWYNGTNFSFDVNITDGNTHQVALYVLDWDQQNRSETVQVVDAASGLPLSSTSVSNFSNGEYLIWTISGHVRINIATAGGPNCVVSGVFFGGAVPPPPPIPSLRITKAHSGHVLQGQQNFPYVVVVSNAANAGPTSGAVTVTESVPSGLTLVAMSGHGWTCPANTTYCTRSDALGGGTSYDPIAVIVNVASNASSPQINQVSVSGGGSATASTSDSTIIESTGGGGGATATFVAQDSHTQGAWLGVYGGDGYSLANSAQNLPTYDPSFAVQNQQNWTWADSTIDPRALQVPGGPANVAAAWYNSTGFSFDVNLTDGDSHQVALYLLDWDQLNRSETVQVVDANSNAPLASTTVSNFADGVYLVWTISGHVKINVTSTGALNAVVSGVFFGGAGSYTPPPSATASWVTADTVTQGNWIGLYGTQASSLAMSNPNILIPAALAITNESTWTWAASTSNPRALETDSVGDRAATTWYSGGSFNIDLNLTDGQHHEVALYALDWDQGGRAETITVTDANSGAVLDTRSIPNANSASLTFTNTTAANFSNGTYLVWNVSGHVSITVTTNAGLNAVVSGVFLDPNISSVVYSLTGSVNPSFGAVHAESFQFTAPALITSETDLTASQLDSCVACAPSGTAVQFYPNGSISRVVPVDSIGFTDANGVIYGFYFPPGAFSTPSTYTASDYPPYIISNNGTLTVRVKP